MGTSRTPEELVSKLARAAREIGDVRPGLNAAALAAKETFIATESGVVGHRVARGKIGVRYDIRASPRRGTAIVRFTGPAHLALNPTRPHRIAPRGRRRRGRSGARALTIGGNVRAYANHPGTKGIDPGAAKAKAAASRVVPEVYRRAALTTPLRSVFG